jgi:threonine synthase
VPLVRAASLGARLGLDDLWLLDETAEPTGSFKDRVVATALGEAIARGQEVVACASTGNLAFALAAGATRAGLRSVVLVPERLEVERVEAIADAGATVVVVRGDYDAANRLAGEAAAERTDWGWVNVTLRPWYIQGARTAGYEVARGLGWRLPDAFLAPMASGSYVRLAHDALVALPACGLVDPRPVRMLAAEPGGCAPVATAFAAGAATFTPVHADTIAASVAMGDPTDGDELLAIARATDGAVVAAPEATILAGVAALEETEGILAEPAGGVVVQALAALVEDGAVRRDETIVAAITGAHRSAQRSSPLVDAIGPPASIEPTLAALADALDA